MTRRIYTRTGDEGDTGLFGGGRVSKANPRVEAYGAVDELNAVLGWVLAVESNPEIHALLGPIQADLFAIGAHLATPGPRSATLPPLPVERVAEMERWMDRAETELPELRTFVLPGGAPGAAALHVARTVSRRAERRVVALAADEPVAPEIVIYLNRFADLLFVAARVANLRAGARERLWDPRGP